MKLSERDCKFIEENITRLIMQRQPTTYMQAPHTADFTFHTNLIVILHQNDLHPLPYINHQVLHRMLDQSERFRWPPVFLKRMDGEGFTKAYLSTS